MKDSKITFRISEADKKQLETLAATKDVPVAQLIREAIKNLLKEAAQ